MERSSLHPLDVTVVRVYVQSIGGPAARPPAIGQDADWLAGVIDRARSAARGAAAGDEAAANALTYGLGQVLAAVQPTFVQPGVSLTAWEARVDRGVGMLMRPPSRLFIEAGLDIAVARAMPIRLDLDRGFMGGAFIPARLVGDLEWLLETKMDRLVRRLVDAELDGVAVMGLMFEAATYARTHGLGLYEAVDVVTPDAPATLPPGARVVMADRQRVDPVLRRRLAAAAKPPKRSGLIARLMRRPDSASKRLPVPPGGWKP